MGKKLVMVVNENGYRNLGEDDNFCMVGIVFDEESLCGREDIKGELEKKLTILKKIESNDISDERFKSYSSKQKIVNNLVDSLPMFLEKLKFSIIISSVRTNLGSTEASYDKVVKSLFSKYNMYITKRNMLSGGIISEDTKNSETWKIKQHFFDIYNEMNNSLNLSESLINSFVVADRSNEEYKFYFDVLNLLDDIIKLMCEECIQFQKEKNIYIDSEKLRIISEVVKNRVINEAAFDIANEIINDKNIIMKKMNEEIAKLKDEIQVRNEKIYDSKKQINELRNKIEVLQEKLEQDIGSRNENKIAFGVLTE